VRELAPVRGLAAQQHGDTMIAVTMWKHSLRNYRDHESSPLGCGVWVLAACTPADEAYARG